MRYCIQQDYSMEATSKDGHTANIGTFRVCGFHIINILYWDANHAGVNLP